MDANEFCKWAEALVGKGMAEQLKNGKDAVSVSLMLPGALHEKSRTVRKEMLKREFEGKLIEFLGSSSAEVDFNSISPSAQTIQAKLSVDQLKSAVTSLQDKGVEVYPNTTDVIL